MMISTTSFYYRSSNVESTPINRTYLSQDKPNEIDGYQRTLILHVIEHWKWKTNEHHQLTSTAEAIVPYKSEISTQKHDKHNANDELLFEADKCQKMSKMTTMKKRETPVVLSSTHRRKNMINHLTPVNRPTDGNLLSIEQKKRSNKRGNNCTSTTFSSTPIFIAPKKSTNHPSSIYSGQVYDSLLQTKRKPILQRQNSLNDFRSSSTESSSSSTLPSISSRSETFQSTFKGENPYDSLFIRDRRITRMKTSPTLNDSLPTICVIPATILITDPSGYSHVFDPDDIFQSKNVESNDQDDSNVPIDNNTLGPHSVFNTDPISPEVIIIPATPPPNHEKHKLDSIGEEEEEEEEEEDEDEQEEVGGDKSVSKEVQHIEKPSYVHSHSFHQLPIQSQDDLNINRRWSDGICLQDKTLSSSSTSECSKDSSTKTNFQSSMKVSIGKYLLMKLHLTPSNKNETSTTITPRKGTVRRSANKKRYQTR